MVHGLEGVHAELLELHGAQAADELAQSDHLCSAQTLRRQVVVCRNPPPHRLHLLRRVILVSERHRDLLGESHEAGGPKNTYRHIWKKMDVN